MAVANWLIGVLLASLASFVSNLGLNLQKLNHTINEQKIRAQIRAARRGNTDSEGKSEGKEQLLPAAAAYGEGAPLRSGTQFGSAGTRVLCDSRDAAADAQAAAAAAAVGAGGSYQNEDAQLLPSEPGATDAKPAPSSVEGAAAVAAASGSGSTRLAAAAALQHVDYSAQGLWRLGLGLVTLGSILDFCALMFAAQSIVAPLGSLTLVSNTLLAPLLLGESVSRRDLLATGAIVVGSATAVVFADHADTEFSVEDIFDLFMTARFACYAALIAAVTAALLAAKRRMADLQFAQPRRYALEGLARYHRFTYAALAGTIGAQSVLFAKCTGEILANSLRGRALFLALYWQTWAIGGAMFATIYFQIKWLNAGLQRFDALYIVPVFQSFWILVSVAAGMVFFGEYKALASSSSSAVCFPLGVAVTIAGVYVLSQRGGGGHGATGSVKSTPQQRNYRHYCAARPGGLAPHGSASSLSHHWSSSAPAAAAHGDPLWETISSQSGSSGSSRSPAPHSAVSVAIPCGAATAADEDDYDNDYDERGAHASFPLFAHSTPVSPSPAPPMSFLARSFIDYPAVARGTGTGAGAVSSFAWQQRQVWGPGTGTGDDEEDAEGECVGLQSGEDSEGEANTIEDGAEGRVPMSARSYHSTATATATRAHARPPMRQQRAHPDAPIQARFEIDPSDIDGEASMINNSSSSGAP